MIMKKTSWSWLNISHLTSGIIFFSFAVLTWLPDPKPPKVAKPSFPCTDPKATFQLVGGPEGSEVRLEVREESPRLGLFGVFLEGAVKVSGRCCWELYDRAGFTGKMMR